MNFLFYRTGLTVSVLKLISSLLTNSGKSETDHFAVLFDEMEAKSKQSKHAIVSNDEVIGYQKLVGKRKTEINHASELIFSFLVDLFHCTKSKLQFFFCGYPSSKRPGHNTALFQITRKFVRIFARPSLYCCSVQLRLAKWHSALISSTMFWMRSNLFYRKSAPTVTLYESMVNRRKSRSYPN